MCSTRDGSQGMYITFASAMGIRQPSLALKPKGDVTRNPKQGYQWPQNRDMSMCPPKIFKKKERCQYTAEKTIDNIIAVLLNSKPQTSYILQDLIEDL